MLFVGTYERQLDDKGRLALPAIFRDHLGDNCYLAKGRDKCVMVVPAATFEAELLVMTARVNEDDAPLDQLRAIAASAKYVQLDKQGRVTVEDDLRNYAEVSVGNPVVVTGRVDRLEIWAPERQARVDGAGTGGLAGPNAKPT